MEVLEEELGEAREVRLHKEIQEEQLVKEILEALAVLSGQVVEAEELAELEEELVVETTIMLWEEMVEQVLRKILQEFQ